MTDWDHNLGDLVALYQNPEQYSDEEVLAAVIIFLIHVPNHVVAAKKIGGLGPIEDVFEVGILEADPDD